MEGPHDDVDDVAAEQMQSDFTDQSAARHVLESVDEEQQQGVEISGITMSGTQADATINISQPVFVQSDDGSLIYRSFRVREAKVCETVSFPLAALPATTSSPRSNSLHGSTSAGPGTGAGADTSAKQGADPSSPGVIPPSSTLSASSSAMPYIFCEMQELTYNGGRHNFEWRESTRWMFFEECVERPGDRWSKPHVPSLPAASVFDFRNCLISGTIVLNLDASSFEELADMVGDILIATNQLSPGAKPEFLSILHLRHLHHFEYKHSTLGSLKRLVKTARINAKNGGYQTKTTPSGAGGGGGVHHHDITVDIDDDDDAMLDSDYESRQQHLALGQQVGSNPDRVHNVNPLYRRYVPYNAQAASILVGEVAALRSQMTVFVRLARPLYVGDLTEIDAPLKFVCIILGPPANSQQARLNASSASTSAAMMAGDGSYSLATMGRVFGALLSNPAFSRVALRAENREGLMAAFDAVVDRSTLLPAETWDPDVRLAPIAFPAQSKHSSAQVAANRQTMRILPTAEAELDSSLTRTGYLFGGLVRDIQRKMPFLPLDFTDCLHLECGIASVVMLLTTLTWLLVFSAMYETMTEHQIGTAETFLGACLAGIVFYLVAGQPLTVIGTTTSLFAFERALFAFCKTYDLNYIGFHFWVIFWTLVVLFVIIMFDLSAVVCYFTRFSQEIFSVFVASVLMVEAIASLVRIKDSYPLTDELCVCARDVDLFTDDATCRVRSISTCHHLIGCKVAGNCAKPNSFIFSCLLFVMTYLIIAKFKSFRSSFMLPNRVRVLVGNFALPLTVIAMTIFASCIGIDIPRLHFSHLNSDGSFATTDASRGLVVDPGTVPAWAVFTAALVALPCALLVVMDQHFAAIIVNRRENRLRHGCGYHLDLAVVAVTMIFSAVFGLPMFAGVIILSYANIVSLQHTPSTSKESKIGYTPMSFRIREQRVSSLIVSILIGFCILLRGIFAYIPVAVLYGVFFYIGLAMLTGTQLWHRIKLMLIPIKYQPDFKFLRYIELVKVNVYTIVQLALFLLLWLILILRPIAFVFPLILLVIALVRRVLAFGFSRDELLRLDATLLPMCVICRPSTDPPEFPSPGSTDYDKGKMMGGAHHPCHTNEFVEAMRTGMTRGLRSARDAIRRQFVERRHQPVTPSSGGGRSDDEEEEPGERSALSDPSSADGGHYGGVPTPTPGEKQQQARRSRQADADLADEVDQVRTASILGSPTSNSSSVYDSATAAIANPSSSNRPPSSASGGPAIYTTVPTPSTSSPTARLLTTTSAVEERVEREQVVMATTGLTTRISVIKNVSAVTTDEECSYDADGGDESNAMSPSPVPAHHHRKKSSGGDDASSE